MSNSIWKLTALTGVIGLGCLVIFWAQQGLSDPEPADSNESVTANTTTESEEPSSELENFVSAGQGEPAPTTPTWKNADDQNLAANSEPGNLDDERTLKLDDHLRPTNSNSAVANPFDDPSENLTKAENSSKVEQANLTKTKPEKNNSDNNPFGDKAETAGFHPPPANENKKTENTNSDLDGPLFQPDPNNDKKQKEKPVTKEEGPIFSPDSDAFQDKTEKKTEPGKIVIPATNSDTNPFGDSTNKEETQSKAIPDKVNPFANNDKPLLLNREPVKTISKSDQEKTSSNPFGNSEKENLQKTESDNPFDSQNAKGNLKVEPLKISSPKNGQFQKEESKANPFSNDNLTKPKDSIESLILPQKKKTQTDFPSNTDDKKSADQKTLPASQAKKTAPAKPEVIDEKSQKPQLSIEKIAPRQAVLGQSMVYRIVVKNTGRSPAYDLVVEDAVPENVKLIGTIPQARLKNQTLFWKFGTLEAGESKKILVKVIPQQEGQISSSAKVNFTSKVASKTKIEAPKLKFVLLGPKKAGLGDKITYRYRVENTGTIPVKDVWVRGLLPNQLSHPAGDDVESQVGTLHPRASKIITLQVSAKSSGTGIHRAILTASGNLRLEAQSAIVVQGEKVKLTRYGPQHRPVGKQAVFTNMVTNKSQETITGAVITEKVPKGMKFVEATEGGQYDPSRRTVNWPLGKLKPQESKSFKIKLIPRVRGHHNTVVNARNNSGTLSSTSSKFEVVGYSMLRMDIPATKGPLEIGDTVSMTVTVRNLGTSSASNIRLQLTLPPELKLVDVKGPEKFRQIGRTVEMNPLAQLAAGKSVSFEIRFRAAKTGDSRVGVQIRSDEMQKPLSREEAIVILPQ